MACLRAGQVVRRKIMTEFSLTKAERLSGEQRIARLFQRGKGGFVYPFRYVCLWGETESEAINPAVLISVSKRYHKRANRRNLLKRRIREAYRLHKHSLVESVRIRKKSLDIALIYTSKEIVPYKTTEDAVRKILEKILREP